MPIPLLAKIIAAALASKAKGGGESSPGILSDIAGGVGDAAKGKFSFGLEPEEPNPQHSYLRQAAAERAGNATGRIAPAPALTPMPRPMPMSTGSIQGPISHRGYGGGRPPMRNPNLAMTSMMRGRRPVAFDAGFFPQGGSFRMPWETPDEQLDETGHGAVMMHLQPGEEVQVMPNWTDPPAPVTRGGPSGVAVQRPLKLENRLMQRGPYANGYNIAPIEVYLNNLAVARRGHEPSKGRAFLAAALSDNPIAGYGLSMESQKRRHEGESLTRFYEELAQRPGPLSFEDEQRMATATQGQGDYEWDRPTSRFGQYTRPGPGGMVQDITISREGEKFVGDPRPRREEARPTFADQSSYESARLIQDRSAQFTLAEWENMVDLSRKELQDVIGYGGRASDATLVREIRNIRESWTVPPQGVAPGSPEYNQWADERTRVLDLLDQASGVKDPSGGLQPDLKALESAVAAETPEAAPEAPPTTTPFETHPMRGVFEASDPSEAGRALIPAVAQTVTEAAPSGLASFFPGIAGGAAAASLSPMLNPEQAEENRQSMVQMARDARAQSQQASEEASESNRRFMEFAGGAADYAEEWAFGPPEMGPELPPSMREPERSLADRAVDFLFGRPAGASPMMGPTNEMLAGQIEEHEGLELNAYDDTSGVKTIGYGFNLEKAGARGRIEALGYDYDEVLAENQDITEPHARQLMEEDLEIAKADAEAIFPGLAKMTPRRQQALIDMAYNMGRRRLLGFFDTVPDINAGRWESAAKRLRKSDWAKQVGSRATKLIKMIEEG